MNHWEIFRKSIPALFVGLLILVVGVPCFTFMAWALSTKGTLDVLDFMFKVAIGCAIGYCVFIVPLVFHSVKQGKTLFSRNHKT